jgi:putative tricarboxylic transport membrane protein
MITKNRIGGLLILAFCVTYWLLIDNIRLMPFQEGQAFTARTIPQLLAILGIGLSLIVIVLPGGGRLSLRGYDFWRVGAFLLLMSAYGFTVRPLGFLISTSLFLMIGFTLLGERRLWMSAGIAIPLVVLFWILMTQGLEVFIAPWPAALR